jgi:hypothetical protein
MILKLFLYFKSPKAAKYIPWGSCDTSKVFEDSMLTADLKTVFPERSISENVVVLSEGEITVIKSPTGFG